MQKLKLCLVDAASSPLGATRSDAQARTGNSPDAAEAFGIGTMHWHSLYACVCVFVVAVVQFASVGASSSLYMQMLHLCDGMMHFWGPRHATKQIRLKKRYQSFYRLPCDSHSAVRSQMEKKTSAENSWLAEAKQFHHLNCPSFSQDSRTEIVSRAGVLAARLNTR